MKYQILSKKKTKSILKEIGLNDVCLSEKCVESLNKFCNTLIKQILSKATKWRGINDRTRLNDQHVRAAIQELGLDEITLNGIVVKLLK